MMKSYTKLLGLLFAITALAFNANGQTIQGVVFDEFGGPMPGVTVRIDGTTKGDATDLDGKYTINNAPVGEQVLVFTFIGYRKVKKAVNVAPSGTVTVDMTMEVDSETLQEYVVVGYGVQRKR
ncbi:MAG: carboxypeptidase-like regulatory domain-containing protein, partial [Flavobacteriales bacterium]|nr:carboxypeptidase-like regulatory domain-containing protein [Flavobacteriales bacterium]